MTLVRRNYLNNEDVYPGTMGHLFENFFNVPAKSWGKEMDSTVWAPRTDVEETKESYILRMDVPRIKKEDLPLSLEKEILTIRGERKDEIETDAENRNHVERHYGEFKRSFTLPQRAGQENISADYKDGVLTVSIPKTEEEKPRQITVK